MPPRTRQTRNVKAKVKKEYLAALSVMENSRKIKKPPRPNAKKDLIINNNSPIASPLYSIPYQEQCSDLVDHTPHDARDYSL